MPTSGALHWVVAAVVVADALELPADLDGARVQVDERPAEAKRLALADADGEANGPAGAVAPGGGVAWQLSSSCSSIRWTRSRASVSWRAWGNGFRHGR